MLNEWNINVKRGEYNEDWSRAKELREAARYNKKEVVDKLEMPYTTYSNYETDMRDVGSETLRKIARFYGGSIDYILENEINYHNNSDEFTEYLDELRYRPEMRMLFSVSKKATKEDVENAVIIIEMLRGKDRE